MLDEKRQEEILLTLKRIDYATREQLQKMHSLGKSRNALRVLNNMSEYLSTFTHDRKYIFYLNREGRERVNAEHVRKKTMKIDHYLMRNDLYIHLGRPFDWKNEQKVRIPDTKLILIPDARFVRNKLFHYIEVDNKQSMSKNRKKIEKYKALASYTEHFNLIWITTTPYRKNRLQGLSEGINVTCYLWDDIK